ncbi:hypothetical protein ACLB2K_066859 [Fragaria x ananassa]
MGKVSKIMMQYEGLKKFCFHSGRLGHPESDANIRGDTDMAHNFRRMTVNLERGKATTNWLRFVSPSKSSPVRDLPCCTRIHMVQYSEMAVLHMPWMDFVTGPPSTVQLKEIEPNELVGNSLGFFIKKYVPLLTENTNEVISPHSIKELTTPAKRKRKPRSLYSDETPPKRTKSIRPTLRLSASRGKGRGRGGIGGRNKGSGTGIGSDIHKKGEADGRKEFESQFKAVFSSSGYRGCGMALCRVTPLVSREMNEELLVDITMDEVSEAVHQMGALKAPGPD